jgi:hypothetical protein
MRQGERRVSLYTIAGRFGLSLAWNETGNFSWRWSMAEGSGSSSVASVAIVVIVVLAAFVFYFMFGRGGGGGKDIDIDVKVPKVNQVVPAPDFPSIERYSVNVG